MISLSFSSSPFSHSTLSFHFLLSFYPPSFLYFFLSVFLSLPSDRGSASGAVPVPQAAHTQPGQQLPDHAAVALRRAHQPHPAGTARQPARGPARGAVRVPPAQALGPGRGGGPLQHAAARGQRAAVARRQGAGVREGGGRSEVTADVGPSGNKEKKRLLESLVDLITVHRSVLMFFFVCFFNV